MSREIAIDRLGELARPGELVFLHAGVTAPTPYITELLREPGRSRGLRLLASMAPGIASPIDVDRLDPDASLTGLFMQPGFAQAQRDGRYRALAMSYGGFARHLQDNIAIDLAVVQVSPPDAQGNCSLGPSVEFAPLALAKAKRALALINPQIPHYRDSVSVPLQRFDHSCEIDIAVVPYKTDTDEPTRAIAAHIASLVDDGSALQMGLGKVPTALAALLRYHRGLRLYSGMLSDGLRELAEAGALDPDFKHTSCIIAGSPEFYRWAADFDGLRLRGCEITHDARNLAAVEGFIAVNSALEVDLFGQCNLEHAEGRAVSGAGGAPDFARAARLSRGGCSIVALNASYLSRKRGAQSRILARLGEPCVASLSRVDVDCVITEFGIADLRGIGVNERARALIAVAAPEFREGLEQDWAQVAARL